MAQSIVSKNHFVGTWKLINFKSIDLEKKIGYPFGQSPQGYIIYTENGYMTASIMVRDRQNIGLSIEEMQKLKNIASNPKLIINLLKYIKAIFRYFQAARNYISYSGTYEIKDNKVIHHVEVSLIPDWVGTDFERTFEFLEDKLVLVPPKIGNADISLTWQRV